jgi:hypothetical protein
MPAPSFNTRPNVPFIDGTEWSKELAYEAFYHPLFDGQTQFLGHRDKLEDVELSDAPGQIKDRFAILDGGLRVTAASALNVAVSAGVAIDANGNAVTIGSQQVLCANNATGFIFLTASGTVAYSTSPPVVRKLLARVVTVGGVVSTVTDLRSPGFPNIAPIASSVKTFGGSSTTDIVCTNGQVFNEGMVNCRNFTVPSGVTITIDKFCKLFASGNVLIQGTVNVDPASYGGQPASVFASSVTQVSSGVFSGTPGAGLGGGSDRYSYLAQPVGSGGQGARTLGSYNTAGLGGRGGGGFWVEAAGSITVTTAGSIIADGTQGISSGPQSMALASGATGGGGGSGGLIYLASLVSVTVQSFGSISVKGGNGGNSALASNHTLTNWRMQGGGGGGGGWFVVASPSINLTGAAISLAAGSNGAHGIQAGYTFDTNRDIPGALGGGFGGASGLPGRQLLLNFVPNGD